MKISETHKTYHPEKDNRWDAWRINSIDRLQHIVTAIQLNSDVSEDIIKRFDVIKNLILHSYYVYEFLDVALDNSLLTFEMALKIRFREITGNIPKMRFEKLIEWGAEQELFEDKEPIIQSLRKLRNMAAHPKSYRIAGHMSLDMIQRTANVINGLYEDINLRKERKQEEHKINSKLEWISKNGAVLQIDDKRLIIFKAMLIHFNNNIKPNKYYILFWPIFDPTEKNREVNIGDPLNFEFTNYKFEGDIFHTMNDIDRKKVKLTKINKLENEAKYKEWKDQFENSNFPLQTFINMRVAEIRAWIKKYSDQ